jgi:hypothetical protein
VLSRIQQSLHCPTGAAAGIVWGVPKINHWDHIHLSKHWFPPLKHEAEVEDTEIRIPRIRTKGPTLELESQEMTFRFAHALCQGLESPTTESAKESKEAEGPYVLPQLEMEKAFIR